MVSVDPFGLNRFVVAQEDSFAAVLAELGQGAKRSHWMWFVFPQIAGLGSSPLARFYAIGSIGEATAYLAHRVLGPRYHQCVALLQELPATTAETVFGPVDAVKLRSSLTLFAAATDDPLLTAAIDRWFAGERDEATLRLLATLSSLPEG